MRSRGRFRTGLSFRKSSRRFDVVRTACTSLVSLSVSSSTSILMLSRCTVASSAAAEGVGARISDTKSAMVKSVSWPTEEITGTSDANIALATISSLNAHKSSMEPPPRPRMIISALPQSFASFRDLTISSAANSPCTNVGNTAIFTRGSLLFAIWIISRTAAPVGDVITAMVFTCSGSSRLKSGSKRPSAASFSFICSKAICKAPMPTGCRNSP